MSEPLPKRSIHNKIRPAIPILILLGVLALSACSRKEPTNIIIILADDLGYGDVKCYNMDQGKIATPNIDRLASEGMRFTDAHSSSGVCSPSRYVLLTGRYHWRTRLQRGVIGLWEQPLIPAERLTIAGLAKQQGYRTAIIGKWHLGWDWPIDSAERSHFTEYGPFEGTPQSEVLKTQATEDDRAAWANTFSKPIDRGPTTVGFDSYFGTDVPNWPPFCFIRDDRTVGIPSEFLEPGLVSTNQASFQGPALMSWRLDRILPTLVDSAEVFIKRQAKYKTPFLLYMPLTVPHTPVAVAEAWKNKSGLGNTYADFVMEMDDVVGRVMQALEESGIAGNTMLIFTSDNGCAPYIGMKELEAQGHLPSGPLRGYKGEVWEGGHRIPFVVRLPGVVEPGSVCDKLVQHADLMATFADLFGAKLPDNAGEDSFSLMPLLKGRHEPVRENAINCRFDGLMGIRKGPWKLVCAKEPELYNLKEDLGEKSNVAADHPEIVKELLDLRRKLIDDGRSTLGKAQKNDVEVVLLPEP